MKLGFIGTGAISSDVITGICKSKLSFKKIVISPRNRTKASFLKKNLKIKLLLPKAIKM
jgi:pyrroline-5-carboxylate reductase